MCMGRSHLHSPLQKSGENKKYLESWCDLQEFFGGSFKVNISIYYFFSKYLWYTKLRIIWKILDIKV